jgi:hypothetical protein
MNTNEYASEFAGLNRTGSEYDDETSWRPYNCYLIDITYDFMSSCAYL